MPTAEIDIDLSTKWFRAYWIREGCSAANLAVRSGFRGSLGVFWRLLQGHQRWRKADARPLTEFAARTFSVSPDELWSFLIGECPAPSPRVAELAILDFWYPHTRGENELCRILEAAEQGSRISRSFLGSPAGWLFPEWISKRVNATCAETIGDESATANEVLNTVDRRLRSRFMNQRERMSHTIECYLPASRFTSFIESCRAAREHELVEDMLLRLIVDAVRNRHVIIGLLDDDALAASPVRAELARFESFRLIDRRFLLCRERGAVFQGWAKPDDDKARHAHLAWADESLAQLPNLVSHELDPASIERTLATYL